MLVPQENLSISHLASEEASTSPQSPGASTRRGGERSPVCTFWSPCVCPSDMVFCAWYIAVILLLQLLSGEAQSAGDVMNVSIICYDRETMEVTWDPTTHSGTNLSLEFRYPIRQQEPHPCPHYFLLGGFTSGCTFPARRDLLEVTIRKGRREVFKRTNKAWNYLKPRPLQNITLHWLEDSVVVTCRPHPYSNLRYEVQHRSFVDPEWQTESATSCNVTVGGLDPERCYDFRVRATPQNFYYGLQARPSDWSHVTRWEAGQREGSCPSPAPPRPRPQPLPIACGLAMLLTLLLLLLLLRLRRVKNVLMPCVPDPKGSFPGLFEKHHGNFQEWIADTQAVAPVPKLEVSAEDDDIILPQGKGAEPEGDVPAGFHELVHQDPRGGAQLSVGGFTFLTDDSAYMTL